MLVLHQSESAVVEGDSDHLGGKIPMDDDNQECIQRALSTEATDKYSTCLLYTSDAADEL